MTLEEIKNEINNYNSGTTYRGWIMSNDSLKYVNKYLSVVRIDSSNHWVAHERMSKMWSIIYESKADFTTLNNYLELQNILHINITPVLRGKNKGCYGLRIYEMKQNPDAKIVKHILDFIFNEK